MECPINFIEKNKLLAIIRTETAEQALKSAHAVIAGGIRLVEITLTVPDAYNIIQEVGNIQGVIVGAGTILDIDMAEKAIASGAKFLVSPHTDPKIILTCKEKKVLAIPGAATPNEVIYAHGAGADIVKIFPAASLGGPNHLRFLKGPLPFVKLMPTGGVSLENVSDYFAAGAVAVGVTNNLIDMQLVKASNYEKITETAAAFVDKLNLR